MNSKEENSTFVPITSKSSASVLIVKEIFTEKTSKYLLAKLPGKTGKFADKQQHSSERNSKWLSLVLYSFIPIPDMEVSSEPL